MLQTSCPPFKSRSLMASCMEKTHIMRAGSRIIQRLLRLEDKDEDGHVFLNTPFLLCAHCRLSATITNYHPQLPVITHNYKLSTITTGYYPHQQVTDHNHPSYPYNKSLATTTGHYPYNKSLATTTSQYPYNKSLTTTTGHYPYSKSLTTTTRYYL